MPTPLQLAQENLQKIQNEIFVLRKYVTELQKPNKNKQEQESSIRTTLRQTYPQEFEVSTGTNLLSQILLKIQTLESNKNFLTTKVSQEQQKETAQLKIEQATQENLKRIKELSTEINLALKEKRMQDAVKLSDERRNIKKQVRIADIQKKTTSPKKAAIIPSMNNEAVTSDEKEMQLTSKTEVELEQMKCVNVLLVTGKMKTSGDEDLLSELGIANPTEFLQKTQEATVAAEKGSAERIPVRFLPKWCVNELSNVSQNASSEELDHRLSSEAFRKLAILAKRSFEIDQIKKVTSDVGEKYSSGQIKESKDMWNNIEYNTVQAVLEDSSLLNNPATLNERVVQLMLKDSQVSDEWKQNYQIDKKGTPTTAIAHFSEEIQRVKRDTENKIAKGIKGKELWNDSKEVYQPFIQKLDLDIRYPTRSTETILAEREAMFKAIAQGTLLPKGAALPVRIDNRENLVNEATFALKHTINGSLDYDAAIRSLDRARDAARGIDSKWIAADKANGQPMAIYLSDARNAVSADEEKDTFENWASMGLSYFRIAEKMIEMEIKKVSTQAVSNELSEEQKKQLLTELNTARLTIQQGAHNLLIGIQSAANAAVADKKTTQRDAARDAAENYMFDAVSNTLVPFLSDTLTRAQNTKKPSELPEGDNEKARLKTLREDMGVLRDFGALDREPFTQVTINNAVGFDAKSGVYTVRTDVPLYDLTSKQRGEFIAILNRDNLLRGEELPQWYSEQPQIIQDLIHEYTPAILAGRDLPTQMFKYIPTLRNAAEVRCYSNTLGELNEYFAGYRSGNIGNDIKKEPTITKGYISGETVKAKSIDRETAIEATAETMRQVNYLTGFSNTDNLYLNSVVDLHSLGKVYERNKEAARRVKNVRIGNMATNMERYAQGTTGYVAGVNRDLTAANTMCDEMSWVMTDAQSNIKATSPAVQRIIIQLAWVREEYNELLSQPQTTFDAENTNAHLTAKVEQMASLIKQYYQKTGQEKKIGSIPFCKSGKDRAAIIQIIEQSEAEAKNAMLDRLMYVAAKQFIHNQLEMELSLSKDDLYNNTSSPAEDCPYWNRLAEQLGYNSAEINWTDFYEGATDFNLIQEKNNDNLLLRFAQIIGKNKTTAAWLSPEVLNQNLTEDETKEVMHALRNVIIGSQLPQQVVPEQLSTIFKNTIEKYNTSEISTPISEITHSFDHDLVFIPTAMTGPLSVSTRSIKDIVAAERKTSGEDVVHLYEEDKTGKWRYNVTKKGKTIDRPLPLTPEIQTIQEFSKKYPKQGLGEKATEIILDTIRKEGHISGERLPNTPVSIASKKIDNRSVLEQICVTETDRKGYTHFIEQSAAHQITGGHNGRISSNQSIGSEGIKNDGDILPPSLFAEDKTLVEKVTRRTAKFNSKLKKQDKIVRPTNPFILNTTNRMNLNSAIHRETETRRESLQIENLKEKQTASGFSFLGMLKAFVFGLAKIASYLNPINWITSDNNPYTNVANNDEEDLRLSQRDTLVAKHSGGNNPFQSLNAHNTRQEIEINKMSTPELLIERDKLVLEHHITLLKFKRSQKKEQHTATDNVAETTYLNDLIVKDMRLKAVHEELGKREHDRTAILAHTKPSINADTQDASTQFQNKLLHEILHEDALHPKHGENAEKTARKITADADRMSMTSEPRHSIGA